MYIFVLRSSGIWQCSSHWSTAWQCHSQSGLWFFQYSRAGQNGSLPVPTQEHARKQLPSATLPRRAGRMCGWPLVTMIWNCRNPGSTDQSSHCGEAVQWCSRYASLPLIGLSKFQLCVVAPSLAHFPLSRRRRRRRFCYSKVMTRRDRGGKISLARDNLAN